MIKYILLEINFMRIKCVIKKSRVVIGAMATIIATVQGQIL